MNELNKNLAGMLGFAFCSPQIQALIEQQHEYQRIVYDIRNLTGASEARVRAVAVTRIGGIAELRYLVMRADDVTMMELTAP